MSTINLANVAPKTRKTRAPRREGEERERTYIQVVRQGKDFLYIGPDEDEAKRIEGENEGSDRKSYGTRASLPPSVFVHLVKRGDDLATIHAALGGKMGASSQNDAARDSLAGYIRAAFDAMNGARKLEKKPPVELPTIDSGEWFTSTSTKQPSRAELAELAALGDEFE